MTTIAYTQRLSMVLPEELTQLKQFILWRFEPDKNGKPAKVPIQCTGYPAKTTEPRHWSWFSDALKFMREPKFKPEPTGIGFVFTADDPYCGIDLDGVWQSDADEGAPWAVDIMERFSDTYGEESPSETGYKIWCKATLPRQGCKWEITPTSALEIYDRGRFFTLTGASNKVLTITDHQADIERMIEDATPDIPSPLPESEQPARFSEYQIQPNHRWKSLVSLAGSMRHRRPLLDDSIVRNALLEMNRLHCQGKYSTEKIEQIVGSFHE